jgi:HlyD family secretion protein
MAKKSSKRIWIGVISILVLAGVAVGLYLYKNKDTSTKVQVQKSVRRNITQTVTAIGKIQPETEVKISSEASGEVIALTVKEGEYVNKGKLLVRIQPDLVDAQVEQSRAAVSSSQTNIEIANVELERAKLELNRVAELYKKEYASKQEWETAKANYERAQGQVNSASIDKSRADAALRQIQVSASRTTIYSPISGTVTKMDIEQGEKVVGTAQMQGTEIMRISDLSVMNAIVDVDENDVVKLHLGDTARVKIDAFPNRVFNGYVYEISHSPKQKGIGTQDEVINFEVKIRIVDKELAMRPGMSCNVEIETETHPNVIAVPLQAVTIRSEKKENDVIGNERELTDINKEKNETKLKNNRPPQVIFVYDKGIAKKVDVETGISDRGFIEITKGIQEGQTVISGSFQTVSKVLDDGMKVSIDSTGGKKSFKDKKE